MRTWYQDVAPLRLRHRVPGVLLALLAAAVGCPSASAAEPEGATAFRQGVEPILSQFCSSCHNSRLTKGGVAFDQIASDPALLENRDLWSKALKMLRAGL